jgi:hypothetical protein
LSIAYYDQRIETKPTASFHDLGDAAGVNHTLLEPAGIFLSRRSFPRRAAVPGTTSSATIP